MKKALLSISLVLLLINSNAQINSGLVGHYTFNNGNANDESGNANHGVTNGASLTTDRFGNANKAYSFDGLNDYIDLGDASQFRMGSNDFSISLWVNYSATQQANLISKRDGAASNYNMYTISIINDPQFGGVSQNVWTFLRSSNSNDRDVNAGNLSGAWHNITLVHDYSDSSSIFVDGQFVGSDLNSVSGIYDIVGRPLVLGYASESNSNFYNGEMDDIRIYNRALNQNDINAIYNEPNPSTSLENGLVAKYSFNDANANDEIGTNHGVVNGASLTSDRFGNLNKAYSFDGIDDNIVLGDAPEFRMGANDFAISLWVNYSATQQANIISKRDGAGTNFNMYTISILNDPQFGGASQNVWTFLRSSNSNDRDVNAGNLANAWHHIVLTHDYSDSSSIYVDGQFVGADLNPVSGVYDIIGQPLVLGYASQSNSNFYNGSIDDIRIYNRQLNSSEVNALFIEQNPMPTGIENQAALTQNVLYPNPAKDFIYFTYKANAVLVDVTGKVLIEKQGATEIDLKNISDGMYFIILQNDNSNEKQYIKIIKQ